MSGCGGCDGSTLPSGPAGADGRNAFTVTTANFTQPAVGSTVNVSVLSSGQSSIAWAGIGQVVFIVDSAGKGGYYEVGLINSSVSVTVKLLSNRSGTSTSDTIASGAKFSPSGVAGASGSSGSAGANGANGQDGVAIIDADVTNITTTQTAFTSANKTISIPANTWQTVDDTVELEVAAVFEQKVDAGGLRVRVAGNNVEMYPTIGDIYIAPTASGVNFINLKLRLVMSASGTLTPITNFNTANIATYSNGLSTQTAKSQVFYKGPAIGGLTLSNVNNIDIFVAATTGSGSSKILYTNVTKLKRQ